MMYKSKKSTLLISDLSFHLIISIDIFDCFQRFFEHRFIFALLLLYIFDVQAFSLGTCVKM